MTAVGRALAGFSAVLAVASIAAPAVATGLVESEHFHDVGSAPMTECEGLVITESWDVSGSFTGVARGPQGVVHFRDSVRGQQQWFNEVTKRSFSVRWAQSSRDMRVTDNGDGTATILVEGSGTETYFDSDGRAVLRNPGLLRWEVLIDTGGTLDDPSDDEFLDFLGVVKGSTGRNDLDGRDFCADLEFFTS